jgi:hypothetical protein
VDVIVPAETSGRSAPPSPGAALATEAPLTIITAVPARVASTRPAFIDFFMPTPSSGRLLRRLMYVGSATSLGAGWDDYVSSL